MPPLGPECYMKHSLLENRPTSLSTETQCYFNVAVTIKSKQHLKETLHLVVWYASFNELFVMVSQLWSGDQTNASPELEAFMVNKVSK